MSPINGMGYDNGKKVPQVGGNSPTNFTPPNKVNEVGRNTANAPKPPAQTQIGGNYYPKNVGKRSWR